MAGVARQQRLLAYKPDQQAVSVVPTALLFKNNQRLNQSAWAAISKGCGENVLENRRVT